MTALFNVDDDMLVHEEDVNRAFEVWKVSIIHVCLKTLNPPVKIEASLPEVLCYVFQ